MHIPVLPGSLAPWLVVTSGKEIGVARDGGTGLPLVRLCRALGLLRRVCIDVLRWAMPSHH